MGEASAAEVSKYDRDFYAWTKEQAALLRAGRFSDADITHIAEEIESMGRKWEFQPDRRSASREATIMVQRHDLHRHMTDNPSLRSKLDEAIEDAYRNARILAGAETGLGVKAFSATCPWGFDEMMTADFWPGIAGSGHCEE